MLIVVYIDICITYIHNTHMYICIYMYVTRVHTHMYICIFVYTYIFLSRHTYLCVCACVRVCACMRTNGQCVNGSSLKKYEEPLTRDMYVRVCMYVGGKVGR